MFRVPWGTLSLNQQLWFVQIWEGFLRLLLGYYFSRRHPFTSEERHLSCEVMFLSVTMEDVGSDTYLVIGDESGCLTDYSAQENTSQRIMQSCPSRGG